MQSFIHWFLFGLYLAVMFDSAASGCETNKQIRTKHEHRQPRKFRHAHITIIYIVSATKEILIKWGKNSVVSGYGELLYKESWKIGKCLQLNGGMHWPSSHRQLSRQFEGVGIKIPYSRGTCENQLDFSPLPRQQLLFAWQHPSTAAPRQKWSIQRTSRDDLFCSKEFQLHGNTSVLLRAGGFELSWESFEVFGGALYNTLQPNSPLWAQCTTEGKIGSAIFQLEPKACKTGSCRAQVTVRRWQSI